MPDKTTSNCAVVIPIYKDMPSENEAVSLRQCLNVLGGYPIIFVTPHRLDCERYKHICAGYKISAIYESFNDKFFCGYDTYSAFLTSGVFYERFLKFKYILIYQLDAFVFKDDLANWCDLGYDYVGGPYFDLRRGADEPTRTEFFNGGFSLRKTETFHRLADVKLRGYPFFFSLMSKYSALVKKTKAFNLPQRVFLFSVTKFMHKFLKYEYSEDCAWTSAIRRHGNIAPFDESLRFSFDTCPEYAFKLNGGSLPFGCHGWTAYYNWLFWKNYVNATD